MAKLAALFLLSAAALACTGGDGATVLEAHDDVVTIAIDEGAIIDILDNDVGFDDEVQIEIIDAPLAGEAQLVGGRIEYDPYPSYIGADDIRYRLTNADGTSAEARVAIDIGCDECLDGRNIRLRWLAPETNVDGSPATDLLGYRVYAGLNEEFEEMSMIDDLNMETPTFDFAEPGIIYDAWYDLGMVMGDRTCFRLTAYNGSGESDPSNVACIEISELEAAKTDFPVSL